MPYYKETFVNRSVPVTNWRQGVVQRGGSLVLDQTWMTSFRNRPHSSARSVSTVSDIAADPYAYFLDSTSRRKYQARLSERGLPAQGDPDRGHTFDLKRHTITGQLHDVTRVQTGTTDRWLNAIVQPGTASTLDTVHAGDTFVPAPYKESSLGTFAQQAYARSAPTAVVFDASRFLGELREGLPSLVPSVLRRRASAAKGLGDDYLNAQFGWIPLVTELRNAAKALADATNQLANQGQRVHRRYSIPGITQADSFSSSGSIGLALTNNGNNAGELGLTGPFFSTSTSSTMSGQYTYAKTRSSSRWFEGEFSSFYPLGFDPSDYMSRLSVLMNWRITPSTLYELAPWTWLVDWSLRIADSIRANEIHANDLLVMHYGYAMETAVYTTSMNWRTTSGPTPSNPSWSGLPLRGGTFATTTYKKRLRANPYGFRVGGGSSLTSGQLAILGALGLTKLK